MERFATVRKIIGWVAERQGFEPWVRKRTTVFEIVDPVFVDFSWFGTVLFCRGIRGNLAQLY